ncbi:helix-turn-helix domain-containing protein [Nonomuraea sp. NBC_01738]|uniref:helix-turn-helix domain-containing protein n=1 Tax=Nonomuraea sp. NBC_01738 TaxID=2976003 RepID=UPI002E0F7B03|nr:helix-turn-helix domain-containing protein [Nonomuraea sp. NBC_01738]
MAVNPGIPAEAALIRERREQMLPKLSIRKAAARAEMSEASWRHIESGRNVGPADKIALMAREVGVTPDELDDTGRGDAARLLRNDVRQRAAGESAMSEVDPAASSEALLQMILQGLDEIRRAPTLTDEQKKALEKSLIRSVMSVFNGQMEHIKTAIEIARHD